MPAAGSESRYHARVRALITGVTGFVGSHLAEYVISQHPDVQLFGMRRWRSPLAELAGVGDRVQLVEGDLLDPASLHQCMAAVRPDLVFHLAASSSVAASWDTPNEVLQVNAVGTLHLLQAVRQLGLDPVVVLACSAEAYGDVDARDLPIVEQQPFRPLSPYAVSKATVDLLGYQFYRSHGTRVIRLRLFNHVGPRQADRFVVSGFARQIAAIEEGTLPPRLKVGNLDARRDFVDVRDVARAYWLAATRARAGEAYNVCSGRSRSVREVVDLLLERAARPIEVAHDPSRVRPVELPVLEGSPEKLARATAWRSQIPIEQTLADVLQYWRGKAGSPA